MNKINSSVSNPEYLPQVPVSMPAAVTPTVLVVEDDRRFAHALEDSFAALSIKTLLAHDGNIGLAMAISRKPDFMLLDTRMPARSGYLVLEYLINQTDLRIPTILLSESEGKRHQAYGKMLGAIDFFEKPIKSVEVVAIVAALLKPSCRVPAPKLARDR